MQARLSLRNWLSALFFVVCAAGCGWKPSGDTLVLPDGSYGGVEVVARDPANGRGIEVQVMAAPYGEEWPEDPAAASASAPHRQAALDLARRARHGCEDDHDHPDTFVQVMVDMPVAGRGSRLVPDVQCAIIKGSRHGRARGTAAAARRDQSRRHESLDILRFSRGLPDGGAGMAPSSFGAGR